MLIRVVIPIVLLVGLLGLRVSSFPALMGPWQAEWVAWIIALIGLSFGLGYGVARLRH